MMRHSNLRMVLLGLVSGSALLVCVSLPALFERLILLHDFLRLDLVVPKLW